MTCDNGFFKVTDRCSSMLDKHPLQPGWWSRRYEYPWAIGYAKTGQIAADMGCGWFYRPFKDALADRCEKVYAVDIDKRLLELPNTRPNLTHYVADFCDTLEGLPEFDVIYCISVLEDVQENLLMALTNFAWQLKKDGRLVITFDVPYEDDKPCPHYPGMPLSYLEKNIVRAGLKWDGPVDYSKANAIHHDGFNLTVFHGVLKHVRG